MPAPSDSTPLPRLISPQLLREAQQKTSAVLDAAGDFLSEFNKAIQAAMAEPLNPDWSFNLMLEVSRYPGVNKDPLERCLKEHMKSFGWDDVTVVVQNPGIGAKLSITVSMPKDVPAAE